MRLARSDFARLLATVTKVVESRNTIPILSTVRLIAGDGKLAATATDLDIEISGSIDAETPEAFTACIDAKLLAGIVNKVAGDTITIEATPDGATLKAGRSRYQLQTLPIDDFPTMAADGFTAEFTADMGALFAPVQFAMSNEETRYYLNGIYLHVLDGKLAAVATDGHRLSLNHGAENGAGWEGVIVPRKTVGLVPKGDVTARISGTKIQFCTADTLITSKLIDGTFPDYQRVIPKGNDKIVTFDVPAMKQAVERVSVISSERGRAVKLSFADNVATLAVNNPEAGAATEEVAIGYAGDPLEIGFNSAYLSEIVSHFPAGDMQIALADNGSPALFTSAQAEGRRVVLMPRRV